MKTLWDLEEPWFMPVAATTRFLAPVAITEINCQPKESKAGAMTGAQHKQPTSCQHSKQRDADPSHTRLLRLTVTHTSSCGEYAQALTYMESMPLKYKKNGKRKKRRYSCFKLPLPVA